MSNWTTRQRRVDAFADAYFAEPVELHPWSGTSVSGRGVADTKRSVVKTEGMFVNAGSNIVGEGGTMGAQLDARIVQNDCWVSVQDDKLGGAPEDWKKGDRVYLPDRGEWYEISYPNLSATRRPQYHLIRLQAGSL